MKMKSLVTLIALTSVCFGKGLNIQWETVDVKVPVDTTTAVVDTTYDETNWDDDYNHWNEFKKDLYDYGTYQAKQHITNWYIHEEARVVRVLFHGGKK